MLKTVYFHAQGPSLKDALDRAVGEKDKFVKQNATSISYVKSEHIRFHEKRSGSQIDAVITFSFYSNDDE